MSLGQNGFDGEARVVRPGRAVGSLNMPTELPGFYWDEAKNRYFPISSRPKHSLPPPLPIPDADKKVTQSLKDVKSRLQSLPWSGNETIRTTNNCTQRWRASQ